MMRTVHVVEPGGRGGVYQHAAALAAGLAEAGARVTLHTARDAEDLPLPDGVDRRGCFWRLTFLRPRLLRRAGVVGGWLAVGVPRCLARVRPGDIVHIEGRFVPALFLPLVAGARLRRCAVGFSPHTTFSRRPVGRMAQGEEAVVRWLARHADVVLSFSDYDRAAIEAWGARPVRSSLAVGEWATRPDPELVTAWRERWGGRRPVVLFAGQVRHDKGLELAVAACAQWRHDTRLAVVGEDHGALAPAMRAAADCGVELLVDEGYQPLPRLVAAFAAADVVICPYRAASTSGVLALAAALGRPTVATEVGGSAEYATVTVAAGDAGALAAGVDKALAGLEVPPSWPSPVDVARAFLVSFSGSRPD